MIDTLVVNGCSYMACYSNGNGHADLAARLGISRYETLARPGGCNNRIIRTTLKHSYTTDRSCFYLVGLTFMDREELPIGKDNNAFEGRWLSVQNGFLDSNFDNPWTQEDTDRYARLKATVALTNNAVDRLEELMYRVLSMISDLRSRGHNILVFQQVNDVQNYYKNEPRLSLLDQPHIVDQLQWSAIPWQVAQGAQTSEQDNNLPREVRHVLAGQHEYLNNFLESYIRTNDIHL